MTIDENHPFSSFGLSEAMLQAIARKGWTAPSSIQSIALPRLLADEGHCIVKARTGTGKTAAFGIPLIERLTTAGHAPRALILAPTRELALQVAREISSLVFDHYPRITAVYGGASIRNQILDLRRGTEIVVGTPGRIMDLMERKALDVSAVDWFILDEADEMLDMGFFEDVEKILASVNAAEKDRAATETAAVTGEPVAGGENAGKEPAVIRTGSLKSSLHVALFSATMPEPILKVIRKHIGNAEIIVDSAPEDEKPLVDQFCIIVRREDKLEALRRLIDSAAEFYGLIFCATKAETDELARRLVEAGYPAEAIHGDLSQEIRERTLRRFRLHRAAAASGGTGEPAILVATDVAARGLDIENLSHVINWDLPNDRETYVHRIGRTGRAGRRGIAISLATLADRFRLQQLSKMAEKNLGSGILWLKVPSVKAVMKTLRRRVTSAVLAVFPELPVPENISPAAIAVPTADESSGENGAAVAGVLAADVAAAALPVRDSAAEGGPAAALTTPAVVVTAAPASPFLAKVCRGLIEQLGAEKAVEALVTLSYGEMLDPARYSPITEFSEDDFNNAVKGFARGAAMGGGRGRDDRKRGRPLAEGRRHSPPGQYDITPKRGHPSRPREEGTAADYLRVYVGMGKQHDCGARDIAALLGKAGGVPGRLVDEIQMKDYCAFATLPADAARKACAFSKKSPREPVIRLANPVEHSK